MRARQGAAKGKRWLALLGLAALLGACGGVKDNLVVVVPGADGHVGAVTVTDARGETVLDQPYAAATAGRGATRSDRVEITAAQVDAIFGQARAAQPKPPVAFRLYFLSETDQLTPESTVAFEGVFTEIASRAAADTVVTGHTDTAGTDAYNDALALNRASAVRAMLIARGLPPESIATAARGKRELLIPTADQVHEPRNRRVEITVR
jgi:outer membrane protein OmpA-like peptidoglycan-associated protein